MNTIVKYALIALVGVVLGFVGSSMLGGSDAPTAGTTNFDDLALDSITVTGASTLSGAVTISGELNVSTTTATKSTTIGGENCTLTDANGGAFSLTQELLNRCSYFKMAAGGAGQAVIQLTPVATSSLTTFIPSGGQCKTIIYDASALVAATTTTMTATAGHILIAGTNSDDILAGAEYSEMSFCRQATGGDITWIISDELVDAD